MEAERRPDPMNIRSTTTEGGTGGATGDTGEAPGEGGGLGCGNDM